MPALRRLTIALLGALAACSDPPAAPTADLGPSDATSSLEGRLSLEARAPDQGGGEADRFLGADRDAFLDELIKAIDGLQLVSEAGLQRLGLTWKTALQATRARFRAARTPLDAYHALLSLQRSYHDVHSRLELSGALTAPAGPPVALPLTLRAEHSGQGSSASYVVTAAPGHPEIAVGARLDAVDGRSVAALEQELLEWVEGSSLDGARESVARWLAWRWGGSLPAPAPGTSTRLRFVDPTSGAASEVALTWQAQTSDPPITDPCLAGLDGTVTPTEGYASRKPEWIGINACLYDLGDGVKLLRWFSFYYEFRDFSGGDPGLAFAASLRDRMKQMSFVIADADLPFAPGELAPDGRLDPIALGLIDLTEARAHLGTATRLLIDLRENGGGNFHPDWVAAFATASFKQLATQVFYRVGLKASPGLLDQAEAGPQAKLAKAYLLANPTAQASPEYPFICETWSCQASELMVAPASQPFGTQVALLAGPGCVSSCDNFVALMKDHGLAKLAGLAPRGGDSPVRLPLEVKLKDGQSSARFILTVAVNHRPGGAVLEGAPPAPDVPVYPSATNRGGYLDAVLAVLPWD